MLGMLYASGERVGMLALTSPKTSPGARLLADLGHQSPPGDRPADCDCARCLLARAVSRVTVRVRGADRRYFGRAGWSRVLRNTVVGFFIQAGTRMAAALSYYALLAAGPMLVLTLGLGSMLFGDVETREIVAGGLPRFLPPSAELANQIAGGLVRSSRPATWLALGTGVVALVGFTRALATSLNAMLNESGGEPFRRTIRIVPLLYLAVLGLLWGSWLLELVVRLAETSSLQSMVSHPGLILGSVAPLLLAVVHFWIILTVVPRARLTTLETVVPAVTGAVLWESSRNLFGWLVATDSFYLQVFGPLGGIVALLGWIYLSCVILVLTGQFAWAFAMERRGRGELARLAPREAGLQGLTDPFRQENAVNEAT